MKMPQRLPSSTLRAQAAMRRLLRAVASCEVDKIVYVSCDPGTLARDIKLLGELGYEFVEATPVDMFVATMHVECIALIQRVKS